MYQQYRRALPVIAKLENNQNLNVDKIRCGMDMWRSVLCFSKAGRASTEEMKVKRNDSASEFYSGSLCSSIQARLMPMVAALLSTPVRLSSQHL